MAVVRSFARGPRAEDPDRAEIHFETQICLWPKQKPDLLIACWGSIRE